MSNITSQGSLLPGRSPVLFRSVRIVPYDRLRDPYGFIKLMEPAFGWPATPKRVARLRRLDARYRSLFGFAALQGQTPVGFVGVIHMPVRTLDQGIETAGGIHAVATDPNYCRKGIARRLMKHAHAHFRRLGIRFSFLCTARTLVAYSLYQELGYSDTPVSEIPRAYRILARKPRPRRTGTRKPDTRPIERVFSQALADRTGFSTRTWNWPGVLIKTRQMGPAEVLVRSDGYAFVHSQHESVFIAEFVALSSRTYRELLDRIAGLGRPVIVGAHICDPRLEQVYRKRGFSFRTGRHGAVMCKPLARTSFEQAFADRFYFTGLDGF